MKTTFATKCIATALLACVAGGVAIGQTPPSPTSPQVSPPQQAAAIEPPARVNFSEPAAQASKGDPSPPPELILDAVPELLRMHLPILGTKTGVLVRSVTPGSSADRAGLRNGDIILEAGGRPVIEGQPLSEVDAALPNVVLRRGRPQILNPAATEMQMFQHPFGGGFLGDPAMQPARIRSTSSASSFSGPGGQAVSISRSGDQISLEMSIPGLAKDPIRLHGTPAEIERKLQTGTWSPAIKTQVRRALQQAR